MGIEFEEFKAYPVKDGLTKLGAIRFVLDMLWVFQPKGEELDSQQLRDIADKLDELNGVSK